MVNASRRVLSCVKWRDGVLTVYVERVLSCEEAQRAHKDLYPFCMRACCN